MSNEEIPIEKWEEEAEEESEHEGSESQPESLHFGEAAIHEIEKFLPIHEAPEEKEWDDEGEYGEGGRFYLYVTGEAAEYPSAWEQGAESVSSRATAAPSEVEETEEEKLLRYERECLLDELRAKLLSRMLIRRKNAFLHKKLVEHYKKRRMENVLKEEPKGLDIESKYLKRLFAYQEFKQAQEIEIDELNISMGQYAEETQSLKESLEDRLTTFMMRAKEVSLNLISAKTGKKLNEKVVDRLLRRYLQKNKEKGSKKLRFIKVKNLIEEKERQLKAMEYFGEGLHIADYEQMKIDNQNYTDKIEEKEDELTKMRIKTQEIMQGLAHTKEKEYAIEGDIELMAEKMYDVETEFRQTRERLTEARKKRDSLREELVRLKSISGLLIKDSLLRDFETSIYEGKNLARNLDRMQKLLKEKNEQENKLSKIVVNKYNNRYHPIQMSLSAKSQKSVVNL